MSFNFKKFNIEVIALTAKLLVGILYKIFWPEKYLKISNHTGGLKRGSKFVVQKTNFQGEAFYFFYW